MKYVYLFVIASLSVISGCQTSAFVSSAASDGDGVTCSEIYQAFDAYDRDRQSAEAWRQLSILISPDADTIAAQGADKAAQYHAQAKAGANIALAIRGCAPIN